MKIDNNTLIMIGVGVGAYLLLKSKNNGCPKGETKVKISSYEKEQCLRDNNNPESVWFQNSCQDTCRNTGEVKCGGWSGGVNTKGGGGIDFRTCVNAYNSCKKGKKCPPGSSCVSCGSRGGIQMPNNWCCRTPQEIEEERERSKLEKFQRPVAQQPTYKGIKSPF